MQTVGVSHQPGSFQLNFYASYRLKSRLAVTIKQHRVWCYENVFFAMLITQPLTEEGRDLLCWTNTD
ncbi:hypothetical protein E3U43_018196 [Larimichthys crocea]|uniref:Uncharacterized protein n=1 Tax=Larimichthys crocea TaxID=215358 RepID=A0ACD3R0W0_LARCR|nr:hypothetical protein E3U43_018196 [Larimichthys crocea]